MPLLAHSNRRKRRCQTHPALGPTVCPLRTAECEKWYVRLFAPRQSLLHTAEIPSIQIAGALPVTVVPSIHKRCASCAGKPLDTAARSC